MAGPFLGDRGLLEGWLWPEKSLLSFPSNCTENFLPTFHPSLPFSFTPGQAYIMGWHLFQPLLTSSPFSFTEDSPDKFPVPLILSWYLFLGGSVVTHMCTYWDKSHVEIREPPDMFGDLRVEEPLLTSMGKTQESTSGHRIPPLYKTTWCSIEM